MVCESAVSEKSHHPKPAKAISHPEFEAGRGFENEVSPIRAINPKNTRGLMLRRREHRGLRGPNCAMPTIFQVAPSRKRVSFFTA